MQMVQRRKMRNVVPNAARCLVVLWFSVSAMSAVSAGQAAPETNPPTAAQDATKPDGKAANGLLIEPGELPVTYPRAPYHVKFYARGNYVPVLRWKLESGALPPGIKLDDDGLLHGEAQRAGEFQFAVSVKD